MPDYPPQTIDRDAVTDLVLTIENEAAHYEKRKMIGKSLLRRMQDKSYNSARAADLWMYLIDDGARRYTRTFPGGPNGSFGIFNKATRTAAAREFRDNFEEHKAEMLKTGELYY